MIPGSFVDETYPGEAKLVTKSFEIITKRGKLTPTGFNWRRKVSRTTLTGKVYPFEEAFPVRCWRKPKVVNGFIRDAQITILKPDESTVYATCLGPGTLDVPWGTNPASGRDIECGFRKRISLRMPEPDPLDELKSFINQWNADNLKPIPFIEDDEERHFHS